MFRQDKILNFVLMNLDKEISGFPKLGNDDRLLPLEFFEQLRCT